jgi:hypothetical protein
VNHRFYIPATDAETWQQRLAAIEEAQGQKPHAPHLLRSWQQADGYPLEIRNLFRGSHHEAFRNSELLLAIPALEAGDVFALVRSDAQLAAVLVEQSAPGPEDPLVSEWVQRSGEMREQELKTLCETVGIAVERVGAIRYRFLHSTAAVLCLARRFCATTALMLLHCTEPSADNFEDFAALTGLFGLKAVPNRIVFAGDINRVRFFLAWVRVSGQPGPSA